MKIDKDFMNQAINELSGKASIGAVVAHRSHKLSHTLTDIVNDIAVCKLPDGTINTFPLSGVFDVNKVKNRAIELKFIDAFEVDRTN